MRYLDTYLKKKNKLGTYSLDRKLITDVIDLKELITSERKNGKYITADITYPQGKERLKIIIKDNKSETDFTIEKVRGGYRAKIILDDPINKTTFWIFFKNVNKGDFVYTSNYPN